jgi:hypothetical protein
VKRGLRLYFGLGLMAITGVAAADERIVVCYNYGCAAEETVRYTESQLAWARKIMLVAKTPEQERAALGPVIGRLYAWAGRQSPIYMDRGGNVADEARPGSMDCIDHSTTTTRLLQMLERRGILRFHDVKEVERRTRVFIFEHYSAVIEESPPHWLPREKIRYPKVTPEEARPERFVVDSWFVNNGKPAVILPLEDWKDGAGPDVEPD